MSIHMHAAKSRGCTSLTFSCHFVFCMIQKAQAVGKLLGLNSNIALCILHEDQHFSNNNIPHLG